MDSETTAAQTNDAPAEALPDAAADTLQRVQELERYTTAGVTNAIEDATTGSAPGL